MNRQEHLLTILGEECAELQQAIAKVLRFGIDDSYLGKLNRDCLLQEYNDIVAVAKMLSDEGIELNAYHVTMQDKQEKVERFMAVSRECGTLDD
jgi:NTP pyrophosphatase (non-canonical NTP hydrolase)